MHCLICKFWNSNDHTCQRQAPQIGLDGEAKFPITNSMNWCGEGKPVQIPLCNLNTNNITIPIQVFRNSFRLDVSVDEALFSFPIKNNTSKDLPCFIFPKTIPLKGKRYRLFFERKDSLHQAGIIGKPLLLIANNIIDSISKGNDTFWHLPKGQQGIKIFSMQWFTTTNGQICSNNKLYYRQNEYGNNQFLCVADDEKPHENWELIKHQASPFLCYIAKQLTLNDSGYQITKL